MPKLSRPRHGSLQFYPRKRAEKFLPRVNWDVFNHIKEEGLLGVVAYKVGMASATVKDDTPNSMTKGRKITIPVTILEVPNMKIFSVRFYKHGKVMKDVVVSHDKDLRRIVKLGKEAKAHDIDKIEGFDDVRLVMYSLPKGIELKKTPDIIEVAVNSKDKRAFVKNLIGKEIPMAEIMKWGLVDVRGLTKGKGLQGPVRRFGIQLKQHKSEKGVRRPGSLGPWHPNYVTFRTPQAGQLGMFTRVHYNLKVIGHGNASDKKLEKKEGFRHYGQVNGNYLILAGSVQGPQKRQILITPALRPSKKQSIKKYELVEVMI